MFWFWILLTVLIVVAISVFIGKLLAVPPRNEDDRGRRQQHMTALKLSGALRHRKSNRP